MNLPGLLGGIRSPALLNKSHPLARGCVGFWLAVPGYNGFGSNKWLDISGYGLHGTLTDMDPATAWVGDGPVGGFGNIAFNGVDNQIDAGTTTLPSTNHTIAAWVYKRSGGDTFPMIVSRIVSGSDRLEFMLWSGGTQLNYGVNGNNKTGSDSIGTDVWRHVVVTYDGVNVRFYIDGVEDSGGPLSETLSPSNAQPTNFGGRGKSFNLNASISNVDMWRRVLSGREVRSLYLESLRGYPNLLNRVPRRTCSVPVAGGTLAVPIKPKQPIRAIQSM